MPKTLSRRTVLRGTGVSIALPLLQVMSPGRLLSAAGTQAKSPVRMAFLYVPNGAHMPDWKPQRKGFTFKLTPTLEKIAEYRNDINVLSGLTLDGARSHGDGGGDHARSVAAFLTGAHPRKTNGADIQNGISVDQATAQYVGDQNAFRVAGIGTGS